jgi:positive regulator of sigma E activity
MWIMGDWFLALPIPWMAFIIFAATYLIAACVYLAVVRLAVDDRRARAFKAFSPGMLPPLGIIFGLLVGFVAVQVWNDFDKAKLAVATEASALRAVVVLSENLPTEQRTQLRTLMNRHIEEAVNREWPAMAHEHLSLASLSTNLVEALQLTVSLKPQDESQRTAQREIVSAVRTALNARRQRIIISQSEVGPVKWAAILLMGLLTLIAIAIVHSDNRLACAIAVAFFATGIALSSLMIAAYSRPFTGEISVGPELLQEVVPSETTTSQSSVR